MKLILPAHAKINLTLEVLGRRPDGYHEIVTVLQAIALCDTLTLEPAEDLAIDAPGLECTTSENLVSKAARLLQASCGCHQGARIRLDKRIPSAAGLGGGSTDAATTLVALNRLWGLGLGLDTLSDLAAQVGSDVPFFLHGPTALAQGRGERLTALPPLDGLWVVLVVPPVRIAEKTRTLYAALSPMDYTDGSASLAVAADLRAGTSFARSTLRNAFERAALSIYPVVADYFRALLSAGAPFARLSGSGPAIFTLMDDGQAAQQIVQRLAEMGIGGQITKMIGRRESLVASLDVA